MSVKLNLKIKQGSTFIQSLSWETDEKIYVPITSISKAAPVVITTETAHGLVDGWRVKITNVIGMKEINTPEYEVCTVVDSTNISINALNSLAYGMYVSGGVVKYNKPVDMTGMIARMQIRPKVSSDVVLLELTTENGMIVLDNLGGQIVIIIPADVTKDLSFGIATYDLELERLDGVVETLLNGNVSLIREVTR